MADYPLNDDVVVQQPAQDSVLSFTITGAQTKPSQEEVNGKKPTAGPPFFISAQTPGKIKLDYQWKRTFSTSLDASYSLIHGLKLKESENNITLNGIYKDGSWNITDMNTWKVLPNGVQQVQYIASKDTLQEASETTETYGGLEEIRGVGVRIPSIAGGWGRTIDGLPTDPNPQNPRKNDDEHKLARETWKNGPIEYRWDYRKGVWSAYNELIEDHYESKLGTWVFGTNNDTDKGYPFLRGKLDDVFWVRQGPDLAGTDGTQEGVKTAEVMIHLDTKLFDEEESGSAALSTVFIVPHTDGTDDTYHIKGEENLVGNELTGKGRSVDIRTTTHFWKEAGIDGEIFFYKKASELDVCCKPANNKFFAGKMIFMDEDQDVCLLDASSLGGSSTISVGQGNNNTVSEKGKWVPAVQIDECELVGEHFLKLVNNDIAIARSLANSCAAITDFTASIGAGVASNFEEVGDAIECLNTELAEFVVYTDDKLFNLETNLALTHARILMQLRKLMEILVNQVNFALVECGCPNTIQVPELGDNDILFPGPRQRYEPDPCDLNLGPIPSLNCDDACSTIELQAPCCTPSTVTIESCGGAAPTPPSTEYGNCQTHD